MAKFNLQIIGRFGQLFKACGNNYFLKSPTFIGNYDKDVKIFHVSCGIIFGQLFTGHTADNNNVRQNISDVCC